jgi:hypothetical protein
MWCTGTGTLTSNYSLGVIETIQSNHHFCRFSCCRVLSSDLNDLQPVTKTKQTTQLSNNEGLCLIADEK